MNDSGAAVRALVRRHGVEPAQLVVVHDELDLPVGGFKLKEGGGLAGHNGLRSIKSHLPTDHFLRVTPSTGTWDLRKKINGATSTSMKTFSAPFAAGDSAGIRLMGSTIIASQSRPAGYGVELESTFHVAVPASDSVSTLT